MNKMKVLIVDDSAFMRKVIQDLLETDPNLEVVGSARNGKDALLKIPLLRPDVLTLDVEMPVMDGLTTLAEIKKKYTLPVIMLSSRTTSGAEQTLQALEKGAFDFVAKPSGAISLDLYKVRDELIEKLKCAYQNRSAHSGGASTSPGTSSTVQKPRGRPRTTALRPRTKQTHRPSADAKGQSAHRSNGKQSHGMAGLNGLKQLILIGTSTGGPRALQELFSQFPSDPRTAVLVVQHMPPAFTASLAQRLHQVTPHDVQEAQDGDIIRGGKIYVAPGGFHMAVQTLPTSLALHVYHGAPRGGHCPSVDVLYESAASVTGVNLITVTMTGMGKDGLAGLKTLTQTRDVYNIAEDASTCVVYGMSKAVIDAQLVDAVLPLGDIPDALRRLIDK